MGHEERFPLPRRVAAMGGKRTSALSLLRRARRRREAQIRGPESARIRSGAGSCCGRFLITLTMLDHCPLFSSGGIKAPAVNRNRQEAGIGKDVAGHEG
jgi:hypothetical protein